MPDPQDFRTAWGNFATGVSVVTCIQSDGHIHGMTANGIASVSLDPLLVLVCVGHNRNTYPLIKESGRFCINILSEDQKPVAEYYAKPPESREGEPPASFRMTETGSAVVKDSIASMDCRVVEEHRAGDHTIFIGEVDEIENGEGQPLLFYGGKFAQLG